MVLRKFIIELVSKFTSKGFDEVDKAGEKFGSTAKRTKRELTDLEKATRAAKEEARKLAKEEREAAKALKAQAKAAAAATRENQKLAKANANRLKKQFAKRDKAAAKALRDQAKAAASALRDQARAADKAKRETDKLAKSQARAAEKARGLARAQDRAAEKARELARAEAKAAAETRRAAAEARKASSSWSAVAGEFTAVAGAAAGVAVGFAAAALPVLIIGAKFESLRAQLDNLLGSAEAGGKAFAFIQEFATATPFQLGEVTAGFVKLQGRGLDPTTKRLTALGDIASANNKTFDDIVEAALDATQGEGERLKEFGIKMRKVGDNVTLAFRGTTLEVANNEQAIIGALTQLGQLEGVAGSMAAQMNTLRGQFSNATDAAEQFLNTAAQSGPLERTGEILGELREKFLDPENAKLFGEALDVVFTFILDAIGDIDPETITAAFRTLVNVLKLLGIALEPFLVIWRASLKMVERADKATERVLKLAEAFERVVTGASTFEVGMNNAKAALGFFGDEVDEVTLGFDRMANAATNAIDKALALATGNFVGDATEEDLQQIANNEDAAANLRQAANKELNQRQNRKGKKDARLQENARTFGRRGRAQKLKEEQESFVFTDKSLKGKKGKKGQTFFDFEKKAKAAALSQGEEFAALELQRLVATGTMFEEAQAKAREAGKQRADELEKKFKETGRIFTQGKSILDVLGLKGPGSVLEGRPAPQSLIISINTEVVFIKNFNQTIGEIASVTALESVTGQGGQAAIEAGLKPNMEAFVAIITAQLNLQTERLLKLGGGGTLPQGPEQG